MKTRSQILWVVCILGLLAVSLPLRAAAQVSESDFNALKQMVQELGKKVQKLEQSHEQDQKTHEQDQQEIQKLRHQLGETQKTAPEAQQKAEAVEPAQPIPGEGNATHNFTLVGDAEVQFGKVSDQHSGFVMADFAPIFLFRAGERVLFEAGFDFTLVNNAPASSGYGTSVNLSFATIDYVINDYVTLMAGNMLLPLGTYAERSAGWLNKFPDAPLPQDIIANNGVGAQLRGAVPLGLSGQSLTYQAYVANGPSSVDGSGNADQIDLNGNVGMNSNGDFVGNLHANPAWGGRVGWFIPWKPHYDLELGISGQTGTWDNDGNYRWSAAVLDAALHVSPNVEVKGEYVYTWQGTSDLGLIKPRGWWIQAGYKLAGLNLSLPLVNNVELVGRFDTLNDAQGTKTDRYTIGYVYYLSNTLWLEGDYEFLNSRGPNALPGNEWLFQISYGF